MIILIATGIYPPDIGGPATNSKILGSMFAERGHQVRILTYSDDPTGSDTDENGIRLVKISRRDGIVFRYGRYLSRFFRYSRDADAIFVQGPISAGLPAFLVKLSTGRKYFLKVVGDHAWEQGRQRFGVEDNLDDFQKKNYGWQIKAMKMVQRLVSRGAEKVIVPSRYLEGIVQQWGVREDKIKVIYNSIEDPEINCSREEARRELGIEGVLAVSVGRLVPWKGFESLIETFASLPPGKDRKLVIIGGGPDRVLLEEKIVSLRLQDRVELTGSIDRKDVLKFLKAADMFVLNTAYEGFPHIVVEAMMMGVPVITTPAGGNPELVEDKATGLMVRFGDKDKLAAAILKLEEDDELRAKLVSEAQESLGRFTKENMVADTMQVLGGGQ